MTVALCALVFGFCFAANLYNINAHNSNKRK